MKTKLQTHVVAFPNALMSSARSPTVMPVHFAREVRNMYAAQSGEGKKRNGVVTAADAITGENITELMFFVPISGVEQVLAVTDGGNIYLKNADGSWSLKHSGLHTSGMVRWTHFAGRLIVCNGLDGVMSWDGANFTTLFQYIRDAGTNLTYIGSTSFSIESDETLYPVGEKVKMRLGVGVYVESTVASTSQSAGVVTVTLNDAVLTASLDEAHYSLKPPKFNFVYAAHDRLWGFGEGAISANFSNSAVRATVYFTESGIDETNWYDTSGQPRYINLADKIPLLDELVAMAVKDGLTVFFFRNSTQIWSGSDPSATGDFSWVKSIPVGAVHGSLVLSMPNDVAFFSRYGARTLSRVLQTEQLEVSDVGSEVDPTISEKIAALTADDASYKKAKAFLHAKQGWFGFKTASESLLFQVTGGGSGWSVFDGIFEEASAFLTMPNGTLYMAKGGQLYIYDETVWTDDGINYTAKWWTPWLSPSGGSQRWANKYVEVISEQGVTQALTVKRFKNYNSSSHAAYNLALSSGADFWDEGDWEEALWDNTQNPTNLMRDHFVASTFSYAFESSAPGSLSIYGFKIYGVQER